jgi:hypothetical protein
VGRQLKAGCNGMVDWFQMTQGESVGGCNHGNEFRCSTKWVISYAAERLNFSGVTMKIVR